MKTSLIPASALTPDMTARWRALLAGSGALQSPFLTPDYCQIIARHRGDVEVAVFTHGDTPVGFFPFHRKRFGVIAGLGGRFTDYHGLIAASDFTLGAADLLTACRAHALDYNHGITAQKLLQAGAFAEYGSPLVDLSPAGAGSFDGWHGSRAGSQKSALKTAERKARKLAREIGPLRFVLNDPDPAAWATMIDWKLASLGVAGPRTAFDPPWFHHVLEDIRATDSADFAGLLSSLYAGDRLVAVHFGMRSAAVWHWWFPTYAPDLGRYSPGLTLLLACMRAMQGIGVDWLDLGRGSERYKKEVATGANSVCEGSIERVLTPAGSLRGLRKIGDRAMGHVLPPKAQSFQRRAVSRVLRVGHLD